MAFGLPVQGEAGPFIADFLAEPTTCGPDDPVPDVSERLRGADGHDRVVVVNEEKVVLGVVRAGAVLDAGGDESILDLIEVGPSTMRPSVEVSSVEKSLKETSNELPLITSSDGRLLGVVDVDALLGSSGPDTRDLEHQVHDLTGVLQDKFGDREGSS